MRTNKSYEYGVEAEKIILKFVETIPKSTRVITEETQRKYFAKISPHTVKRLLENLKEKGHIKCIPMRSVLLWQK